MPRDMPEPSARRFLHGDAQNAGARDQAGLS
jgi:hypothetical protein